MAIPLKIVVKGVVDAFNTGNDLLTLWDMQLVNGGSQYGVRFGVITQDADGPAVVKDKVTAQAKTYATAKDPGFSAITNTDILFPDCSKGTGSQSGSIIPGIPV